MSTKTKVAMAEINAKREIADADREQRETASKREYETGVLSSISKVAGAAIGAAAAKKMLGKKNHPAWYKKFPSDSDLFANIPTWFTKNQISCGSGAVSLSNSLHGGSPLNYNPSIIQGGQVSVISHTFMPYLGINSVDTVTANFSLYPVNQTLMMDITNLGKINSRVVNPDASIPGFYFLGVTDIIAFLAELHFLIDVVVEYDSIDPSIPDALIRGKGWSPDFIRNNVANLRKLYSQYAAYVNANLPIPSDFSLLERRIWLNTTLIRDSSGRKATYMMFNQAWYTRYVPISSVLTTDLFVTASSISLEPNYLKDTSKVERIREYLDAAIRGFVEDDDSLTFVSNMRAAIPESKFFKLPDLSKPIVSLELLNDDTRQQMQNIVTLPLFARRAFTARTPNNTSLMQKVALGSQVLSDTDGWLYPSSNFIEGTRAVTAATVADIRAKEDMDCQACISKMLTFNSFKPDLSNDDILTMTRLHPSYSYLTSVDSGNTTLTTSVFIQAAGTELILFSTAYMLNQNSRVPVPYHIHSGLYGLTTINDGSDDYILEVNGTLLQAASRIDGMYNISHVGYDRDDVTGTMLCYNLWELDNVFVIPATNLAKLHEVCVRSEYFIDPSVYSQFKR